MTQHQRQASHSLVCLSLLLFGVLTCHEVATADEPSRPWLGFYVGSEVPGFLILDSGLVSISGITAPTENINMKIMRTELSKACIEGGGLALVNLRFFYALGEVSQSNGAGKGNTKISPAKDWMFYGDCVMKVTPSSSSPR